MFSIPKVMPFCNAVTTAPGSETGRCDLCLLMILHGCLFWVLAGVNLPLAHDTMINFQIFSTVYAGYLIDGQFPLWLPYSVHGISADYGYAFTFTPAFYAATFIGKLLSVSDSLQMFRLGLYFEEALLVWGLYRLSTLFHRHRATPVILAFTAILSVSWGTQIHWNFQLIYLLPFLLYHLTRWLRGNGLEYAAYASILLTLGGASIPRYLSLQRYSHSHYSILWRHAQNRKSCCASVSMNGLALPLSAAHSSSHC